MHGGGGGMGEMLRRRPCKAVEVLDLFEVWLVDAEEGSLSISEAISLEVALISFSI